MFSPKYGAARGRLSQRFLSCRSKGRSLLRHACISSQAAPKVRMCPDKMIPFYGVTTPRFSRCTLATVTSRGGGSTSSTTS